MDKEQKQMLNALHGHIALAYNVCAEAYLSGFLTTEDLQLYIDHEQSIAQRINSIRNDLTDKELAKQYNDISTGDLPVDEFIAKLTSDANVLELEYNKVLKTSTFTPDEAKQKLNKIAQLEKRLDYYNKLINDLTLSKEEYKPKKKPGRPKKGR